MIFELFQNKIWLNCGQKLSTEKIWSQLGYWVRVLGGPKNCENTQKYVFLDTCVKLLIRNFLITIKKWNFTLASNQCIFLWKGVECYEFRPCMFCNQSVNCDPDYLVCRENVCMLDDYEGNLFVVPHKLGHGWRKTWDWNNHKYLSMSLL